MEIYISDQTTEARRGNDVYVTPLGMEGVQWRHQICGQVLESQSKQKTTIWSPDKHEHPFESQLSVNIQCNV